MRVKMSYLKLLLAFICGVFACHLCTLMINHPAGTLPSSQLSPCVNRAAVDAFFSSNLTLTRNDALATESEGGVSATSTAVMDASAADAAAPKPDVTTTTTTQQQQQSRSNRCNLMWEPLTSRCRRAPFMPVNLAGANLSCLNAFAGPPPVVAIAALPRSGGQVLRTALEFATGVRVVAQADNGQCNPRQYPFVETSYPFRSAKAASFKSCVLWRNRLIRNKPRVANVWGVVVIVRNPFRWLDAMFGAKDIPESVSKKTRCCQSLSLRLK